MPDSLRWCKSGCLLFTLQFVRLGDFKSNIIIVLVIVWSFYHLHVITITGRIYCVRDAIIKVCENQLDAACLRLQQFASESSCL